MSKKQPEFEYITEGRMPLSFAEVNFGDHPTRKYRLEVLDKFTDTLMSAYTEYAEEGWHG